MAQRCFGIAERNAQHREEAVVGFRQHLLGEPAVVGPAQLDFHFLLRMHADVEHAGREQAGVVDAHGVHPALAELDVAMPARLGLLRAAHRVARDAAAHVLGEARLRRQDAAPCGGAAAHGDLLEHVVLHERENFGHVLVLVVVGVHVDDQHVVELALHRLLARVRQEAGGVELLDCYASAAVGDEVHGSSPSYSLDSLSMSFRNRFHCSDHRGRSSSATCRARTRPDWRRATARSPSPSLQSGSQWCAARAGAGSRPPRPGSRSSCSTRPSARAAPAA